MRVSKLSPFFAVVMLGAPAFADEEQKASSEEIAKVSESIARIGCKAAEVEKETPQLFEIDDAECAIGQYDIKLDGDYNILSLTKDF